MGLGKRRENLTQTTQGGTSVNNTSAAVSSAAFNSSVAMESEVVNVVPFGAPDPDDEPDVVPFGASDPNDEPDVVPFGAPDPSKMPAGGSAESVKTNDDDARYELCLAG